MFHDQTVSSRKLFIQRFLAILRIAEDLTKCFNKTLFTVVNTLKLRVLFTHIIRNYTESTRNQHSMYDWAVSNCRNTGDWHQLLEIGELTSKLGFGDGIYECI
jgi:hypothetical protein